jgi:excisionase family DNA binding protein
MDASRDDEYLTVKDIADRLTIRNWIDDGKLPAVRIGRRVRVRRVDFDRVLAQGSTAEIEPQASIVAAPEAIEELIQALRQSRRVLDRLSGARRAELVDSPQQLTEAAAAAVEALSNDSSPTAAETE